MGTIKKFVNGSFSEDFGEFSGNMFGQPFLCVYGKTKQRILPNADIVEWTLCEGLKSYIRFMPSKELKRHLSGKEGADVDGSIVLTKQIAEFFDIDCTEVMMQAIDFVESDGVTELSMIDHLVKLGACPAEVARLIPEDDPTRQIRVVATKHHHSEYGAGVLGNAKVMDSIREQIGDFYIIPSSIHEIIAVPMSMGTEPSDLVEMVHQVNASEVTEKDQLSDSVFAYDAEGLHQA